MARNKHAGSKKGTSKSARYYQNNPAARDVKNKYNTKYHKSPERRKYRSKLNKGGRVKGVYGKRWSKGKDLSHTKVGKLVLESRKKNRARNRGKK
jgi:hypothetical protein